MTTNEVLPRWTRRQRIAALMAAPAVVVALGLLGIEAWRGIQPRWKLRGTPFTYTLGDAIAIGDLQHAYRFIRDGQDPNDPIAVRHPVLTEGRGLAVPPILWAVAMRNTQAVQMLLGFGVRMNPATARQANCLAEALGDSNTVRVLSAHGGPRSMEPCVKVESGQAPLIGIGQAP